jgi:hypothetical protein
MDPSLNLLTPLEAAAKLNDLGICGKFSLAKLANARSDGTGPPFRKAGRVRVFYEENELLAWAKSRVSGPWTSAAEYKAQKFIEIAKCRAARESGEAA